MEASMDAKGLKALERKLVKYGERAQDMGWRLVGDGHLANVATNQCCIVGAVGVARRVYPSHLDAGIALGISESEAVSIGYGFDDRPGFAPRHDLAGVGQRLRARFHVEGE
jgi:hypothetical protein